MNKKGFSLLEMVFVIAIVAILLSTASLSVKKIIEKRALEKAKSEVAETMRSYAERSYLEGEKYIIAVNHAAGTVVVENSGGIIKESIELPDLLVYQTSGDGIVITNDNDKVIGMRFSTVVGLGEAKDRMKVTIQDSKGDNRYTIEMLKNEFSKLISVSVNVE